MSERRRSIRYRIRLPIELDHGTGTTIDMSSSGIYFESTSDSLDMPAQREVPIRFVVNLEDGVDGFPVHLDCLGRVMRVEEAGTLMRVGATIDKARIRT